MDMKHINTYWLDWLDRLDSMISFDLIVLKIQYITSKLDIVIIDR